MIYDVLIVGAGAAGYGCAITLSSAKDKDFGKDKKYILIDDNKSDMKHAKYFNLSGVDMGTTGEDLLIKLKNQLDTYNTCDFLDDTVTKISKKDDIFEVKTKEKTLKAKIVVLASGMGKFEIELENIDIKVLEHDDVLKPNKVKLENTNNKIANNLYVAGLASGAKTMFAIANGEGVKVACDIFTLWTKEAQIVHDTK